MSADKKGWCEGTCKGKPVIYKKSFDLPPSTASFRAVKYGPAASALRWPTANTETTCWIICQTLKNSHWWRPSETDNLQVLPAAVHQHFAPDSRQFSPWVNRCWRTAFIAPIKLKAGHLGLKSSHQLRMIQTQNGNKRVWKILWQLTIHTIISESTSVKKSWVRPNIFYQFPFYKSVHLFYFSLKILGLFQKLATKCTSLGLFCNKTLLKMQLVKYFTANTICMVVSSSERNLRTCLLACLLLLACCSSIARKLSGHICASYHACSTSNELTFALDKRRFILVL